MTFSSRAFPSRQTRSEIDLRQEMHATLFGSYPEIPKGTIGILRKMNRDGNGKLIPCDCVDDTTGEPDKDSFCPICLTGNSFVLMENGTYKEIKDILVGERVITSNGTAKTIVDKQEFVANEFIEIKSRLRNDPIKATKDHIFPVIRYEDYSRKRFIISEVKAAELRKLDLLLLPKQLDNIGIDELPVAWNDLYGGHGPNSAEGLLNIPLTEDVLWMFGIYLAEGCVCGEREIIFTLHIKEKDYADRITRAFQTFAPNVTIKHIEKPDVNSRTINIYNSCIAKWFSKQFLDGCEHKRPAPFFNLLSKEQRLQVLDGIWDGDGTVIITGDDRESSRGVIGMTARQVVYWSQIVLWENGFTAGLSTYKKADRRRVYVLEWTIDPQKPTKQFFEFDNYWATAIVDLKIVKTDIYEPVYDLTVEDNHTFIVNNTLTHNCYNAGYLWNESWVTWYRVIRSNQSDFVEERFRTPGTDSIDLLNFYFEYDVPLTEADRIIEMEQDLEGNLIVPYRRARIYRINSINPQRSDYGRVEFLKVKAVEEDVKYLNHPGR